MENKHEVHNLIILDESGSMASIKNSIIQGFNEIVQTVKAIAKEYPDQEHFISLVTFNGTGQKLIHFIDPVEKLDQIDDTKYEPTASTPLYDAIGFSVNKLRHVTKDKANCNVLVTILTDGEENASKEYSGIDVKKIIEELKLDRWTFTYIGTDHDVEKIAFNLAITNTMKFKKTFEGLAEMFKEEKSARRRYSEALASKEETGNNFYNKEEKDNG